MLKPAVENSSLFAPGIYIYIYIYICIYIYIYMYASLCHLSKPRLAHTHTHTYVYIYIHVYIYIYSCVYIYIHVYIYIECYKVVVTPGYRLRVANIIQGTNTASKGKLRLRNQTYAELGHSMTF